MACQLAAARENSKRVFEPLLHEHPLFASLDVHQIGPSSETWRWVVARAHQVGMKLGGGWWPGPPGRMKLGDGWWPGPPGRDETRRWVLARATRSDETRWWVVARATRSG